MRRKTPLRHTLLFSKQRQQNGAVLVVSLMLLLVLTMLAISGTENTITVQGVVNNTESESYAFSVGETAIADTLSNDTAVNEALKYVDSPPTGDGATETITFQESGVSATTQLSSFKDLIPGNTINLGSDLIYIRLQADSEATAKNTEKRLTHAFVRIGAGGI